MKYELVWRGKKEMLEELRDLENSSASQEYVCERGEESNNLLFKGDNLKTLKHLQKDYQAKIKMIYIDPPYNTGKDFLYKDKYRQKGDKEKHSSWLNFMYPRLSLARNLLKEDGVIFISIDDNEQAQLKLLCDEIFGEENFVAQLIWQKKRGGGGSDSEYFQKEHEYILCYKKDTWDIYNLIGFYDENNFKNIINGKKASIRKLEKDGDNALRQDRPTLYYAIKDPLGNDFYPMAPNGKEGRWRKKPESLGAEYIYWQKSKGRLIPYEVTYFDEVKDKTKALKTRTIVVECGTTTEATNEIQNFFGDKIFDTPKPTTLIKLLTRLSSSQDDIILDFFAGSGTTAQAVMELNAEDGGNRQFILVQLPEAINEKNKTAYDFVKNTLGKDEPKISDITQERIIRASKQIQEKYPEYQGDLGFQVWREL